MQSNSPEYAPWKLNLFSCIDEVGDLPNLEMWVCAKRIWPLSLELIAIIDAQVNLIPLYLQTKRKEILRDKSPIQGYECRDWSKLLATVRQELVSTANGLITSTFKAPITLKVHPIKTVVQYFKDVTKLILPHQ